LTRDRAGHEIELDRPGGYARPRQIYYLRSGVPTTVEDPDVSANPRYVTQADYPAQRPILSVRVANGGAGGAGLIEALAYAYLGANPVGPDGQPYAIAWYLTDTTYSLRALADGVVDFGITYDATLEQAAVDRGEASRRDLIFMDHFVIAGPTSNQAQLGPNDDALAAALKIASHGCREPFGTTPDPSCDYFLSRDDASATEIKERFIFDAAFASSSEFAKFRDRAYTDESTAPWYYKCPSQPQACFPGVALQRSNDTGMYTLTDWGTWLANGGLQGALPGLQIYVSGLDPSGQPLLLNPADGILSPKATAVARDFYAWLLQPNGGQAVIRTYGSDRFGAALYVAANSTPPVQLPK
jgi:ABC-type tungstate transport system permease subunit